MRLNVAVPEAHVSAPVLNAALEAVTRLDESLLKDGSVPTAKEAIKNGVKWAPEPFSSEHFDHAGLVTRRGQGDCDDLAPYHAASLRHTGEDPEAKAIVRRSGPHRWHAIVQRSDGSIDDPSRWAGMGKRDDSSVRGASLALMYQPPSSQRVSGADSPLLMPAMSMRPDKGEWGTRVDIPWFERKHGNWHPTDYAMSSLVRHLDPITSLVRSIEGACKVGLCAGFAHPQNINRLCALADAAEGVGFEELAGLYGEEHARAATELCGSIFKKLGRVAKKAGAVAKKGLRVVTAPTRLITSTAAKAIRVVPGVGPLAAKSLDAANQAMLGNPKALAQLAKDPVLRKLVKFVPGVGPVASEALDVANKVFASGAFKDFGVSSAAVPLLVRAGFPVV